MTIFNFGREKSIKTNNNTELYIINITTATAKPEVFAARSHLVIQPSSLPHLNLYKLKKKINTFT